MLRMVSVLLLLVMEERETKDCPSSCEPCSVLSRQSNY